MHVRACVMLAQLVVCIACRYVPGQDKKYTLEDYDNQLKDWMRKRLEWMDKQLCGSNDVASCAGLAPEQLLESTVPLIHSAVAKNTMCSLQRSDFDSKTDQCQSAKATFRPNSATCEAGQCCEECYGPYPDHPTCIQEMREGMYKWKYMPHVHSRDPYCAGYESAPAIEQSCTLRIVPHAHIFSQHM